MDNKLKNLLEEAKRLKTETLLEGENATMFNEQAAILQEVWNNAKAKLNDRQAALMRLSDTDQDLTPLGTMKI